MRKDLKVLRVKHDLTQKELAEKLGISVPAYNLIEQGKRNGNKELWKKIQSIFNLDNAEVWELYAGK